MKPKMIGNVNAYVTMSVWYNGYRLFYDGTTVDLIRTLVQAGAKDGDLFTDEQERVRRLYASKHETRTGGFWCTQFNVER